MMDMYALRHTLVYISIYSARLPSHTQLGCFKIRQKTKNSTKCQTHAAQLKCVSRRNKNANTFLRHSTIVYVALKQDMLFK